MAWALPAVRLAAQLSDPGKSLRDQPAKRDRLAYAPLVSLGIDELERTDFAILKGKRVGLITHRAARNAAQEYTIQVLKRAPGIQLMCLYGPEHGVDGDAKAGDTVKSKAHPEFGLMAHSLYGETRRPTAEMLKDIDVLAYDVQDIGSRSYTYISTLGYTMEEAAKYGIEYVVLDRPNPVGGMRVYGPRLDGISSFVGLYNIPFVYGLTPGELAQWINHHYLKTPVKLTVVPMRGWRRDMAWEDTGLRWFPPSPKIPNPRAARGYAAIGFIGEIGITNGVTTDFPFEVLGRSQVNSQQLADDFAELKIDGVRMIPFTFASTVGKWKGALHSGLKLEIDPHGDGNLAAVGYYVIDLMKKQIKGWDPFAKTNRDQRDLFDKCVGSPNIRAAIKSGVSAKDLVASWKQSEDSWRIERRPYLLYPEPGASTVVRVAQGQSQASAPAETPGGRGRSDHDLRAELIPLRPLENRSGLTQPGLARFSPHLSHPSGPSAGPLRE
jgi:uncharacterized protein YbbC (DUF1343 family)